jgi:hypothetical protein
VTRAARNGHFEVLQFLTENLDVPFPFQEVVSFVCASKNLDILQFLHRKYGDKFVKHGSCNAASIAIVEFWISVKAGIFTKPEVFDKACSHGDLSFIEWLHSKGVPATPLAMDNAASEGFLEIVNFLHFHRTEGCTHTAMDSAASKGFLPIVEFLHEHRTEGCTTEAMDNAAGNGHLPILQFLHSHRREGFTYRALLDAAFYGRMEVVYFLVRIAGAEPTFLDLEQAIANGHHPVVEFLLENYPELLVTNSAVLEAISAGSIPLIEFVATEAGSFHS